MTDEPTPRALHVVLTNEDTNNRFSEFIEPLADTLMGEDATMGEIYREARDEYGRCTGKVYVDRRVPTPEGGERWEAVHVGWFFISRQEYTDTHEPYLRGAWVTVGEHVPATRERVIV